MRRFILPILLLLLSPFSALKAAESEFTTVLPAYRESQLIGYTRARNSMTLSAELAGRCLEVRGDVGDTLDDSGVFCLLDDTFIRIEIESVQNNRQQVQRQLCFDRQELGRYQKLVKKNFTARTRLEELLLQKDQSRLRLTALDLEEKQLNERLRRHTITGPPRWLLSKRLVEPGEWVVPGQALAQLGDYSSLVVPFALERRELTALMGMEKITARLPGLDMEATARLGQVQPSFDPESRKVNIELELPPIDISGPSMPPGGMLVQLNIRITDASSAVRVPRAALTKRYEEYWLSRENGEQVRVLLLDIAAAPADDPRPFVRISSQELHPGDRLLMP